MIPEAREKKKSAVTGNPYAKVYHSMSLAPTPSPSKTSAPSIQGLSPKTGVDDGVTGESPDE